MSLETGTYIDDLVASNPQSSDVTSQGDDHLRLIKTILQATFPATGKAFRFPTDVAAKTGAYSVVFPDDQNKIIPIDTTSGSIAVTLPSPSGDNANGWGFTLVKTVAANSVTITGTVNGVTSFAMTARYAVVEFVYLDSISAWFAFEKYAPMEQGTKTFFAQSSAPRGWTKTTDSSYNDRALRLVTGSVGPTGGTTDFTSVFTSRTIAQANLPNVSLSGTAASSGSHSHTVTSVSDSTVDTSGAGAAAYAITRSTSVDGAHTHTVSVSLGGSGTAMDFAVKYVDAILATKD